MQQKDPRLVKEHRIRLEGLGFLRAPWDREGRALSGTGSVAGTDLQGQDQKGGSQGSNGTCQSELALSSDMCPFLVKGGQGTLAMH